jgi:GAG-pre-integrase domain
MVLSNVVLRVADNTEHRPIGVGYLKVPDSSPRGFVMVRCYHTPGLPTTIISPDAIARAHDWASYQSISNLDGMSCSLTLRHTKRTSQDIHFPLVLVRGLLYTQPLIKPTPDKHAATSLPRSVLHGSYVYPDDPPSLRHSDCACCSPSDPTRLCMRQLWYQRLGFLTLVSLEELPDHAEGVPSWPTVDDTSTISTWPLDPDTCSFCSRSSSTPLAAESSPASSKSTDTRAPRLDDPDDHLFQIHHLSRDQLRILWHQRLGHMHSRRVSDLHRYATGIPQLPIATELDKCPICLQAKLRMANRGTADSRHATQCNQGISIDFGFMVQQSSADPSRLDRLVGLNGETCYCLITDHYSGTLYGETFRSKAPPLDFLNRWLVQHGLDKSVPNKYVRFDEGGELGNCREVIKPFENAGYAIEPTAPTRRIITAPANVLIRRLPT